MHFFWWVFRKRNGYFCTLRVGARKIDTPAEIVEKLNKEVNAGLLGLIELRPFDAGLSLPRSPAGSIPSSPSIPSSRH